MPDMTNAEMYQEMLQKSCPEIIREGLDEGRTYLKRDLCSQRKEIAKKDHRLHEPCERCPFYRGS